MGRNFWQKLNFKKKKKKKKKHATRISLVESNEHVHWDFW